MSDISFLAGNKRAAILFAQLLYIHVESKTMQSSVQSNAALLHVHMSLSVPHTSWVLLIPNESHAIMFLVLGAINLHFCQKGGMNDSFRTPSVFQLRFIATPFKWMRTVYVCTCAFIYLNCLISLYLLIRSNGGN